MMLCFILFRIFLPPFCSSCKISCSRNILRLHVDSTSSSGCARKGWVAARNLFLHRTAPQHSTAHGRRSKRLSGPRGRWTVCRSVMQVCFWLAPFVTQKAWSVSSARLTRQTVGWTPRKGLFGCSHGMAAAAARGEYRADCCFSNCIVCVALVLFYQSP